MKSLPAVLMVVLLALVTPAWAQEKACSMPDSPLTPDAATRSIPPYPPMAVMTGEGGTTLLEILIGTDGAVVSGKVVQSSGSLRLDEAALEHVKGVWRWKAPVQNCRPMQASTRVSIKWDLRDRPEPTGPRPPSVVLGKADYPPDALARREQGWVFVSFVVSSDGVISMGRVERSSGFPLLDERALALATTRYKWAPATMDGKNVSTQIYMGVSWSLDATPAAPSP